MSPPGSDSHPKQRASSRQPVAPGRRPRLARAEGALGPDAKREVRCRHFPDCAGCPLVGTAYGEQLRAKEALLRGALAGHAELAHVEPEKIVGSPLPFGYRNHAKLVFRRRRIPGGSEIMLGVYRPGTHSVVPAHLCAVHDRRLHATLTAVRAGVEELEIPVYDERRAEGSLRYALARCSRATGKVHLTLVAATEDVPRIDRLLALLRKGEPRLESAFLCVQPSQGNAILSRDIRRLFGPGALVERFGRVVLESRPDAFVQANVDVATRIYATVAEWLAPAPEDTLVDLYGGIGGVGLTLASRVGRVLGIESSPAAVDCANGNAKRAHAQHVRYVAGSAEDAAAIAASEGVSEGGKGAGLLVAVNPPRRGLTAAARDAIVRLSPRAIAYVSCNPDTLARDLAAFAGQGYITRRARPFDMMPQTPHLETVALLGRGGSSG